LDGLSSLDCPDSCRESFDPCEGWRESFWELSLDGFLESSLPLPPCCEGGGYGMASIARRVAW